MPVVVSDNADACFEMQPPGCDGYIGKPIDVATFSDEVRGLLPVR